MVAVRMLGCPNIILRFSNSASTEATEVTCDSSTEVSELFIQYVSACSDFHIFQADCEANTGIRWGQIL